MDGEQGEAPVRVYLAADVRRRHESTDCGILQVMVQCHFLFIMKTSHSRVQPLSVADWGLRRLRKSWAGTACLAVQRRRSQVGRAAERALHKCADSSCGVWRNGSATGRSKRRLIRGVFSVCNSWVSSGRGGSASTRQGAPDLGGSSWTKAISYQSRLERPIRGAAHEPLRPVCFSTNPLPNRQLTNARRTADLSFH